MDIPLRKKNPQLFDLAVSNVAFPCSEGYLIYAHTNLGPRIGCLLNPAVYRDPIGSPPTEFDSLRIAQLGDIEADALALGGVQARFVQFPDRESLFVPEMAVEVPTEVTFLPLLNALPATEAHLNTIAIGNADLDIVTLRRVQPVGGQILRLLAARRWWSNRELAATVFPLLQAQPALAASHPQLSGWIRSTCTGSAVNPENNPPIKFPTLPVIAPDRDCLRLRMDWIRRDCPGAFGPAPHGAPGLDFVAAIREEHAATRLAHQSDRNAAKAKADDAKSVPVVFASALTRILAMCGVHTPVDLQPFWHTMAATPKKERLQVAQQLLDLICSTDENLVNSPPVLTQTLLDRILPTCNLMI